MTNLDLLKREEQDLLARQMMHFHNYNYLQRYGPRSSGGPLTPERENSSLES